MNILENYKMLVRKNVQRQIREHLDEKKITAGKLADKLDKPRAVVNKWLNAKEGHNFSLDTLVELQFKLGIKILTLGISQEKFNDDIEVISYNKGREIDRFLNKR